MNIVQIKRPPSDLAGHLRAMADAVEAGQITDAVIAYVWEGNYSFTYGASKAECIVMSAMLQQNCIDRMRE